MIKPAIPGAQVEETFSSWKGPKGQTLYAFYWVPGPPHDGGPIEAAKEWRETVMGESVTISETTRFMGSKQKALVASLHPKNPEGTFLIYSKGMSKEEFTQILKSLREEKKPDPFAAVKTAERFTIGRVGYAGQEAPAEVAFRELLAAPDAAEKFEALISSASASGQLYALLGLKLSKSESFKKHAETLEADARPVETMEGCIVESTTVKALARKIRKGKFE